VLDALHALDFLLIAGLLGGDSAVAESGSLLLSPALPAQAGNTVFRAVVPDCDIETWSETIGDHVSLCCALSAQARAGGSEPPGGRPPRFYCGDRPSRADGNPADRDASPDKRDYFTQNIGDDTQRSR
jgi:hypothetical protein